MVLTGTCYYPYANSIQRWCRCDGDLASMGAFSISLPHLSLASCGRPPTSSDGNPPPLASYYTLTNSTVATPSVSRSSSSSVAWLDPLQRHVRRPTHLLRRRATIRLSFWLVRKTRVPNSCKERFPT
jgi:hypothetical protein